MEQRIYRGGSGTPESLADFLIQHFQQDPHLRAQKIGSGNSLIVQIGRQDRSDRPALTVAIHRSTENDSDIVVTFGAQNWISDGMIGYAVMMGLIAILFTPWALFALLWPLLRLADHGDLPGEIWSLVETYLVGQGATPAGVQTLEHPHLGQSQQ